MIGVHISSNEGEAFRMREQWMQYVVQPIDAAGLTQPKFMTLASPYRRLFTPLFTYINQLRDEYPDRMIAVIIPELVETRWHQYLLHNQRATALKAALLLRGGNQVIVINVPWYLGDAPPKAVPEEYDIRRETPRE